MLRLVILLISTLVCTGQRDPSFDNQVAQYDATHDSMTVASADGTVTSFFSPDTSIDAFTVLVNSSTISVDVSTPGFSSWSNCTQFDFPLVGCSAEFVRKSEAFPLFAALLNAIHRGVRVRILTNFYHTFDKPGLIDPLSFLCVAGAECTYFRTVTFLHTKYVQVDGSAAIISSVNYDYTSFMSNREAGVIVEGADFQPIFKTLTTYFELDIAAGAAWAVNKYNASVMEIINDPTPVPVVIPAPREHKGAYISHQTPVTGTFTDVKVVANPDNAWDAVSADLQSVATSLDVFIYQITSDAFCNALTTLHSKGVAVTLLVSDRIYDKADYYMAKACYTKLYQAGLTVRKTEPYQFEFSHQKFWVIDKKTVWLSSGNWGETDFPSNGDTAFPPFGQANGWRNTNRDHTIRLTNTELAESFLTLMQEDYSRGYDWSPDANNTKANE